MAQSHEFANITEFAAALENRTHDPADAMPSVLVDGIMRTAVEEGPASVERSRSCLSLSLRSFPIMIG